MLKLGVNIDHVATIRQARYREVTDGEPDPVAAARDSEAAGCHSITVHLREDRRHIQDEDVRRLKRALDIPLNLEMANVSEMVSVASELLPEAVCIVPEKREELTTEGGLDVAQARSRLAETVSWLQALGIEVSLFIDPVPDQIDASAEIRAKAIELHTGAFAEAFKRDRRSDATDEALERLSDAARQGHGAGMKVNAGHGLNYRNVLRLRQVPHLTELNIGHSIVSRAVTVGMRRAVDEMLCLLDD